jgi:hypothetical protein
MRYARTIKGLECKSCLRRYSSKNNLLRHTHQSHPYKKVDTKLNDGAYIIHPITELKFRLRSASIKNLDFSKAMANLEEGRCGKKK